MRYGRSADASQVTLLQTFLKAKGYDVTINGTFDAATLAAVKQFQTDHAKDVLNPWGIKAPTGYVYKSTMWEINNLNCATLGAAFPVLN